MILSAGTSGYARELGLDMAKLKAALEDPKVGDRIKSDFSSGVGVNGTPSFFINGTRFDGNWTDPAAFAEALEEAAKGG